MWGWGVVFRVSRELQFGVCNHDKPHATSCTVGEGDFLYRGKRSLEGLVLKLKLQYFGPLMQRADSLEKTLVLGKTEGRRKGNRG